MNIFDFAMQMELDGKAFYEEQAARAELPELRDILLQLAADEQRHYNIFKAMKEGKSVAAEHQVQTEILESVKNVFENLKSQKKEFAFAEGSQKVWQEAQDVEKKSEDFYRQKADEVTEDEQKLFLNRIADEERKHWVTIENVIQFLDRPNHWLENAEWSNLENY